MTPEEIITKTLDDYCLKERHTYYHVDIYSFPVSQKKEIAHRIIELLTEEGYLHGSERSKKG